MPATVAGRETHQLAFMPVADIPDWPETVVRGGVEPPTFRFSGLRTAVHRGHDRPSVLLVNDPDRTRTALDLDE